MIRLKQLLFEQTGKGSIRVNGKSVTGTKVTNTQNPRDPYTYFVGNDGQYYAAGKKGIWRNLKTSLRPADYKLAVSRIDSWKPAQSTPKGETPVEPKANALSTQTDTASNSASTPAVDQAPVNQAPEAEAPETADDDNKPWSIKFAGLVHDDPEKNDTYSINTDSTPRKWSTWKKIGYDIAPGSMPPNNNVKLVDTGIMAIAFTKSAAELILTKKLAKAGIDQSDNRIGIKVYNTHGEKTPGTSDDTTEIRWIQYSK